MKSILLASSVICMFSCGSAKPDAEKKQFKIVCGDSVETEMFDQNGTAFSVKIPGKCDTVYTNE